MCDTTDRRAFLNWFKHESDLPFWSRNAAWQAWQECESRMLSKERAKEYRSATPTIDLGHNEFTDRIWRR